MHIKNVESKYFIHTVDLLCQERIVRQLMTMHEIIFSN